MNVLETLGAVVDYFAAVRGVGHTKAVVHGATNADALVVVGNRTQLVELSRRSSINRRRLLLVEDLAETLHGVRRPLVFDNYALQLLLARARELILNIGANAAELTGKVLALEAEKRALEAELKGFRAEQAAKVPKGGKA